MSSMNTIRSLFFAVHQTISSFWETVCKTVRPMLSDRCLSVLSVLSCLSATLVYCGQTAESIKMKLGGGLPKTKISRSALATLC